MSIKPGSGVDIRIDSSPAWASPLKALVYDAAEKRLILSQTSPPIPASTINRSIHLSYIVKDGHSVKRLGCSAIISGFGDNYRLSSGIRVQTLIVDITHQPKEISLRKGFRVRPPRDGGISLTIGKREYPVLDISLTGIRFIQRSSDPPFKMAEILDCTLTVDGKRYPRLAVQVVRLSKTTASLHVAVVFLKMDRALQPALSKKILMLEREELSRGI